MAFLDSEDTQLRDEVILMDIYNKRDAMRLDVAGTRVFTLTKDGFIDTTSGWKNRYVNIGLGDVAANSDAFDYPLLRCPVDVTITNIEVGTNATAASSGTHYQSLAFHRSGSSTALFTALTNASTAFTQMTPRAVAGITSTTGKIPAGDTLYMSPTKTGNGTLLYGTVIAITFTVDRPEAQSGTVTDNIIRVMNGEAGTDGLIQSDQLMRDHLILKRSGVKILEIDVDGIMRPGATYIPYDMYHYQVANVGTIVSADTAAKKSQLFKPNGTATIRKIYFGANTAALANDEAAYMEVKIVDDSSNQIASAFVHGPAGSGQALVAGRLYDMGSINETYATIASTEHVQVEYLKGSGTPTDIAGLTIVIVYTFV